MGNVVTISRFSRERAPCGQFVSGEQHRDADDEGLIFVDMQYACGCRESRHEFHDGSMRTQAVRHDGKILIDEFTAKS
jgi:hypothetical protein